MKKANDGEKEVKVQFVPMDGNINQIQVQQPTSPDHFQEEEFPAVRKDQKRSKREKKETKYIEIR